MPKDSSIAKRVTRLDERLNRFLLTVMVVLVVAVLFDGLSLGASEEDRVVSARAFQLVNAQGDVVAELTLREDGPGLFIRDAEGRDRVRLSHSAEQSGLFILDDAGHSRVGIAQFAHGGGGVAIHGPEAKGAAVLYLKDKGTLSFYDTDGNVLYRVPPE